MKILVMKFGGTSVADVKRIENVASIIEKNYKNYKLVVVLSAMAGATNLLQKLINEIDYSSSVENDLIITSGEQVTVGLLSMLLNKMGIKSKPMLGWQVPIITDSAAQESKILNINDKYLKGVLEKYDVIVLTGFQGVDTNCNITSIGRGGTDTTAAAVAVALKAERCDIYTDVDGVFTTDPNLNHNAKKIKSISYDEMLEMSSSGAKVLHPRSVELAMKNNLTIQVLSSMTKKSGTFIIDEKKLIEKEIVSGISYSNKESKITISGIPDKPGISAKIFGLLAKNNINVDMIVQNISQDGINANMTFTVPIKDLNFSKKLLQDEHEELKYTNLTSDANIAKISVVGLGMMSQSGVAEKMFKSLADNEINILAISTSEIKISVLIDKKYTEEAVKSLHSAYKLDNIKN